MTETEKKLLQAKHRLKEAEMRNREKERKVRTQRLIQEGAILEKALPQTTQMTYKEHARQKYQYEKDGDVTVYLYHEAHYREQLAELKERRKEAKRECATINRCISESIFAHMEIPLAVDVENLYMVDVPEFEVIFRMWRAKFMTRLQGIK